MPQPLQTARRGTWRFAVAALYVAGLVLVANVAHAEPGVSARQLLIGQSITLPDGKTEYGSAVQDGIQAYL